MMLTFGQYNVLAASRERVTHDQLARQTEFNSLMVSYYTATLLANGLLQALDDGESPRYELTNEGLDCLIEYERQNPELTVSRTVKSNLFD